MVMLPRKGHTGRKKARNDLNDCLDLKKTGQQGITFLAFSTFIVNVLRSKVRFLLFQHATAIRPSSVVLAVEYRISGVLRPLMRGIAANDRAATINFNSCS